MFNLDLTELQRQAEDNPLAALGAGAMLIAAIAKLIDATSAAQGRRAYAKQVNYKVNGRSTKR